MVKGTKVEFRKKKKGEDVSKKKPRGRRESGMRQRKKQSLPHPPFHSRSSRVSTSSYRTGRS
jgi:hypothetical protein